MPEYQVFVNLYTSIPPDSSGFLMMCLTFFFVLIGLVMKLLKLKTSKTTIFAQKNTKSQT